MSISLYYIQAYLLSYIPYEMLESLASDIITLDQNYTFNPDERYYYNAQRSLNEILLLKDRYTKFDQQNIYNAFKESLGIDTIEKIDLNTSRGRGHIIAFVKTKDHDYVYRQTFGLPEPETYMLLEKDIVDQFKTIGVNSVDILACGSKPGYERQIMEVLPDQDLTTLSCTQAQYDDISLQIGQISAKQYRLPHEGWGRIIKENDKLKGYQKTHYDHFTAYLGHDLDVLGLSQIVDSNSIALLQNHLAGDRINKIFKDTKGYLMSNDLPDHNLRVNKQTKQITAAYDLENAVIFDPICDLGSLPTRISPYPKKHKLIEGFLSHINSAGLEDAADLSSFEEKIALYYLRTILRKMPLAIKGGVLSARHVGLFNDALRDNKLDGKVKLSPEAVKILVGDRIG